MKVLQLIISCCIFLTNGKLIEKVTERNNGTKQTDAPNPVRISRQAYYDDGLGISIEDYQRNYIRKGRYSIKSQKDSDEDSSYTVRVYRDSNEKRARSKNLTNVSVEQTKNAKILIKKPIPKFNEIDEEDFQAKVRMSPIKVADSSEHEDEDFNLDDYEFDVNHDEFVGRGKPLEPRAKSKDNKVPLEKELSNSKPTTTPRPQFKIQSKVVIPVSPTTNKKRNIITKKVADKMKEDYYDDVFSTSTKTPDIEAKRELDEEFFNDSGDSKEYSPKTPVRTIRSPWNIKLLADKMGSKSANILSNILAYLPIFPEAPVSREGIVDVANLDPITGREYMF
ncbi:unnamed protein product [Diatraea saccharalis]|uniref:Uncharacterized protein n=1 Tax=Diatraea saccharalis TaxID=40085 RepID=A0A9N9RBP4_9NEOP|nr:unnamed protein product [Diatraea saccharalis]